MCGGSVKVKPDSINLFRSTDLINQGKKELRPGKHEGGGGIYRGNKSETGEAIVSQSPPAPCACCPGNGRGIMRNAWRRESSFRPQRWSRRGWIAFVYLFLLFLYIFNRLDRRVAVATTRRKSPAHLHHNKEFCQCGAAESWRQFLAVGNTEGGRSGRRTEREW